MYTGKKIEKIEVCRVSGGGGDHGGFGDSRDWASSFIISS